MFIFFFFSSRRRHTRFSRDWSSDVCSSDLRTAAQFMAQLIENLLMLAQLTQSELRRERVDLTRLAHASVARLKGNQPERQIEIVVADGLFAHGDGRLLGIAFDNLLGNAWKFTERRR